MKKTWVPVEPVKRATKILFGRKWTRLTCATCGRRSLWREPYHEQAWLSKHFVDNQYCAREN